MMFIRVTCSKDNKLRTLVRRYPSEPLGYSVLGHVFINKELIEGYATLSTHHGADKLPSYVFYELPTR